MVQVHGGIGNVECCAVACEGGGSAVGVLGPGVGSWGSRCSWGCAISLFWGGAVEWGCWSMNSASCAISVFCGGAGSSPGGGVCGGAGGGADVVRCAGAIAYLG